MPQKKGWAKFEQRIETIFRRAAILEKEVPYKYVLLELNRVFNAIFEGKNEQRIRKLIRAVRERHRQRTSYQQRRCKEIADAIGGINWRLVYRWVLNGKLDLKKNGQIIDFIQMMREGTACIALQFADHKIPLDIRKPIGREPEPVWSKIDFEVQ